jgi:multiple antibiotic resistance protein
MALLEQIILSFITIFVIMDPFASIPAFISLSKDYTQKEKDKAANEAILVALALVVIFLFLGQSIFDVLGISLSSFRIAGGIILAILGLELVLGFSIAGHASKGKHSVAVLIATPLLTGPGVIASIILLSSQYGLLPVGIASLASLAISWLLLRNSHFINDALGEEFIEVLAKVMGLLLVAIGVDFVRVGLSAVK